MFLMKIHQPLGPWGEVAGHARNEFRVKGSSFRTYLMRNLVVQTQHAELSGAQVHPKDLIGDVGLTVYNRRMRPSLQIDRSVSLVTTHMLHVWNLYRHLPHKLPKCR